MAMQDYVVLCTAMYVCVGLCVAMWGCVGLCVGERMSEHFIYPR